MDQGLLLGLAEGLRSGVDSYQKQREISERRKQNELDRQRQQQMFELEQKKSGFMVDPQTGSWIESPDHKEQKEFERQYKKSQAEHLRAETNALKNKKEMGKQLPAGQGMDLAGSASAVTAIDDLEGLVNSNKDQMGPVRGFLSKGQGMLGMGQGGRDARTFEAAQKQRAQVIGKYLEGGKLTDADILRYQQQLPQLTDDPEVAQNKLASLKRLIQQKYESETGTLGATGYDVANVPKLGGKPELPGLLRDTRSSKAAPKAVKDLQSMSDDELRKYIGGK